MTDFGITSRGRAATRHPALAYCCPTKLSQYAIMEKAIVNTKVSDDALTLDANLAAIVVNPHDPDSFAAAVSGLLNDLDLAKCLGKRAKRLFLIGHRISSRSMLFQCTQQKLVTSAQSSKMAR